MRLEPGLLADLDAWAEKLNSDPTRPPWSRTKLVRAVLMRALAEHGAAGTEP